MTWIRIRIRIWIHFFPVRIQDPSGIRIKIKWILSIGISLLFLITKNGESCFLAESNE